LRLLDVTAGLADHDAKFDFPIGLHAALGNHHVVVRAVETRDRFGEKHRLGRQRQAGFLGVIRVVQADGDELADAVHRDSIARSAAYQRQGSGINRAQLGECRGRDLRWRQIAKVRGQIAQATFGIDQTRLFFTGAAVSA
jgi:hypothetical protein